MIDENLDTCFYYRQVSVFTSIKHSSDYYNLFFFSKLMKNSTYNKFLPKGTIFPVYIDIILHRHRNIKSATAQLNSFQSEIFFRKVN